jgi:hypothetical protein
VRQGLYHQSKMHQLEMSDYLKCFNIFDCKINKVSLPAWMLTSSGNTPQLRGNPRVLGVLCNAFLVEQVN